ncbi:hypothetical protein, partial [Streptomyces caniscabiei]|uniref:hypothetical protein n=1 Tax=Streptomyces caniscabiei TaxID=2746961 RepID=UPI0038F77779
YNSRLYGHEETLDVTGDGEKIMWLFNITHNNDGGHFDQLDAFLGMRKFSKSLLHHPPLK